jgi:hypothetical protein
LVCLPHDMKVGFQVLGPWGKCRHSGCRCLRKGSFHRDTTAAPNYTVCHEHKRQLREDNPNCGRACLAKMHMQGFSRWLRDYVETCSNNFVITDEIRNIAAGS